MLVTVLSNPTTPEENSPSSAAWMAASPAAAAATKAFSYTPPGTSASGPPPASPAVNEISQVTESGSTVYLVGGYAKYKQPYVWVRSNLGAKTTATKDAKDMPLKLDSTDAWKRDPRAVRVWHMAAELVRSTVVPPPVNPLAVDHQFFDSLPPDEQAIASGALAGFLREVYTSATDKYTASSALVLADFQALMDRHFVIMKGLTEE